MTLILLCSILASAVLGAFPVSAPGCGWYVKRNNEHRQPPLEPAYSYIEKYDAYYVDKKHGDATEERVLYLTFDAGYENGNVATILDTLKREDVPAAFFVLGHLIKKNKELVLRMRDEGHLVCNHTKNHKDISTMTEDEIRKNLSDLEKMCEEKTGFPLDKYFRPPEGKFTEASLTVTKSMGYKNIFWSYAYADWDEGQQIKPQKALKKLKENLHDGEILLLHPTSKTNAIILRDFVQYAKDEGYRFKSLNEFK